VGPQQALTQSGSERRVTSDQQRVTDHGGDASSALSKLLRQPIPAIRPVYLGPYPPAHLYRFFQLLELGERVRIYKGLEAEGAVLGVWIHRVRITTTPLHHGGSSAGSDRTAASRSSTSSSA